MSTFKIVVLTFFVTSISSMVGAGFVAQNISHHTEYFIDNDKFLYRSVWNEEAKNKDLEFCSYPRQEYLDNYSYSNPAKIHIKSKPITFEREAIVRACEKIQFIPIDKIEINPRTPSSNTN